MVLSIGIVARQKKTEVNPFDVEVRATKAEDFPSRFGRYEVRVSAGLVDDPTLAEGIVKRAKTVCTVSNSLNGEIILILDQ